MTRHNNTLLIDAGNSRIKWGVHDGSGWTACGALPTAVARKVSEFSEFPELSGLTATWPPATRVVACNVAGEAVEAALDEALKTRYPPAHWLRPTLAACGVRNGYAPPERLGADRWAALIGARRLTASACLVVCAGTATTVDWLDATGNFRGGLILPGYDLMRESLARNTAQLPFSTGDFREEPRTTADAITSGCLHAQIGAIERLFSALATEPEAICLLTGGAAPPLAPHLSIPFRLAENLILDGLALFAATEDRER